MEKLLNDIKIEVVDIQNIITKIFSQKVIMYLPLQSNFSLKSKYIDGTIKCMDCYLTRYWGDEDLVNFNNEYAWREKIFESTKKETLNLMIDEYIKTCKTILLKVVHKNLKEDLNKLIEKYNVENIEDLIVDNS